MAKMIIQTSNNPNAKPKKGVAGVNTGGKTRKAIRAAQAKRCSIKSIAASSNRSPGVISSIKSGVIKNPPSNVAKAVQEGCKRAIKAQK